MRVDAGLHPALSTVRSMKLYVCYGTFKHAPRSEGLHPCGRANDALRDAGHRPKVIRSYGLGLLPGVFNLTPGRRRVKELTGNTWVPLLEFDDGSFIQGSREIAAWAEAHPAGGTG